MVILEERLSLPRLWVGWVGVACLVERVGIEWVGPQRWYPLKVTEVPHGPWFIAVVLIMAIRWQQEKWSPLASVSRSSAGGESLKERARLN